MARRVFPQNTFIAKLERIIFRQLEAQLEARPVRAVLRMWRLPFLELACCQWRANHDLCGRHLEHHVVARRRSKPEGRGRRGCRRVGAGLRQIAWCTQHAAGGGEKKGKGSDRSVSALSEPGTRPSSPRPSSGLAGWTQPLSYRRPRRPAGRSRLRSALAPPAPRPGAGALVGKQALPRGVFFVR